ncbi:MAG: sigma-70 family RNA polymerase sigma factor [Clostridia bacterium]|nr:sigma-70 family RNA polymerase sigma factor [Clostridia bacterium]
MDVKSAERHAENMRLLEKYKNGDDSAAEKLMKLNSGLVTGAASSFSGRGVETEDLIQIGSIGMLKAIRSFDLSRGTAFSTYAVPLIIGEIRKYLRDDGLIKVSRLKKRDGARLLRERERFISENMREPRIEELASLCGMTAEDAAVALEASSPVRSLSEPVNDDDATLESMIPGRDEGIERAVDRIALREAIGDLPALWRKIVYLRYFRDLSQQQTADALGLSQVKISREEKKIFAKIREELSG